MAMSLNSLASKTSPHSLHSTNSLSSSRATTCTRGCLHWLCMLLLRWLGEELCGCEVMFRAHRISSGEILDWDEWKSRPACKQSAPAVPDSFPSVLTGTRESRCGPLNSRASRSHPASFDVS